MIGHHVSDRWDRSHAVKRAGARQYASSAVACRTWSSLRSHHVDLSTSFCVQRGCPAALIALQKPSRKGSSGVWFDDLQPQLGRSFFEQLHLLFAVALLVVLQAFVEVLVSPLEHAIHQ